jgi:hypothetical protein
MSVIQYWIFGCLWVLCAAAIITARVTRANPPRIAIVAGFLATFIGWGVLGASNHTGPLAFPCFLSIVASVFALRLAIGRSVL